MAPFIGVRAASRSQNVRIGGQTVTSNKTTWVDLDPTATGKPQAYSPLTDLKKHLAIGSVIVVEPLVEKSGIGVVEQNTIVVNAADHGLLLNGTTDDGPALNALITELGGKVSNQQEAVILVPWGKTLALGTTIKRKSFISIRGEGGHLKVLPALKAGPVFTNSVSEKFIRSNFTGITIDKGELEGVLFDCHSMQNSCIEVRRMTGGSQVCTNLNLKCDGEVETDGDAKTNTVFNDIELIDNGECGYHIVLEGQKESALPAKEHAVCSLNDFHNITARNIYKAGIRIKEWSDTNLWSGVTTLSVKGEGGTALIVNDSATPAANVGVYNNRFAFMTFEAYGAAKKRKGIVLNFSYQTIVQSYFAEPVGTEGVAFENLHSQSHRIEVTGEGGSTLIKTIESPVEIFEIGAKPATPGAGYVKIFFKEKHMIALTSDGVEHQIY